MPPRKPKPKPPDPAPVACFELPRAVVKAGKEGVVVEIRMTEEVRRLMWKGCDHWRKALEGMKSREDGMDIANPDIERKLVLLNGTETEPGILTALGVQGSLDFGEGEGEPE